MSIGQEHQHARMRLFRSVREPFPHPDSFKRTLDYAMFFIGIIAPAALLPQAIRIYTLHTASGVSLTSWIMLSVINVLWAVYGYVHKEPAIYVSNFLIMVLDVVIVAGIVMY